MCLSCIYSIYWSCIPFYDRRGARLDSVYLMCCIYSDLARIAARFANKATPETLNRVTGIILVILGIVVLGFSIL